MSDDHDGAMRFTGTIGLWATIILAVLLGIHPFGTSELYDDGGNYIDHVGGFWITIHLAASVAMLAYPVVIDVWSRALETVQARIVGRCAAFVATIGMAVGILHLVATDTLTFVFFDDTFTAGNGSEAVTVSADLLVRLHAATLSTWVLSFWLAVPALLAVAAHLDGRFPRWFVGIAGLATVLQIAALIVTVGERQWTTLSDMGLFRPGAVLLIILFLLQALSMRTGSVQNVFPRQVARTG